MTGAREFRSKPLGIISLCWIFYLLILFIRTAVVDCDAGAGGSDFYDLLGVSRDADDRTIRRAFKKLALQFHPDKNRDDPSAHDQFVRIKRAYEILKDDESRKKYDLYGEDGVGNQQQQYQQQPHYQSWQFYKDQFGIYDDDAEISTLNAHDFESQVLNNGRRRWFVNFYSAHCSHCHQLAPNWRKFARQVEGVIGVGAVNCLDEFILCQQQGIGYYPSLIMYPERQRYEGSRDVDDLIDFALGKLDSKLVQLSEENYESAVVANRAKPWVIDLCNSEEESINCLTQRSRKLVAAAFDQAITVGTVLCNSAEQELCEKLGGGAEGVYYFPIDSLSRAAGNGGDIIQSLDAKEIVSLVLQKMPSFNELDPEKMKELTATGSFDSDSIDPLLVQFTKHGSNERFEYRLLPSMLDASKIKIGQFNCTKHPAICQSLYLTAFPAFVIFKPNVGFEVHYGKSSLDDVLSFAKECAHTNVRTLNVADFSSILADGRANKGTTWFIDFFAPWCPPCMRLLPEFRKAANILSSKGEPIQFGTVDCTANNQACLSANVHSYPTTVLYNGSKTTAFVGLHNMQELVDFIEDAKNPPVTALNPDTFRDQVLNRGENEIWLVDFFSPHCGPCQQLAPEIRKLSKLFREYDFVHIAELDCSRFSQECQQQNIRGYPTIRAYPPSRGSPIDYNSWFRDVMSIRTWLFGFFPSRVIDLSTDDFYDLLSSDEAWLVDFFTPWCGHCQVFAPEYEKVAEALEGRVRVGKVNCDLYTPACQSALVRAYPTVRFYPGAGAHDTDSQSAYGVEINSQNSYQIIRFVEDLVRQYQQQQEIAAPTRDEL